MNLLSPSSRIGRRPFVAAVLAVYALSVLSQSLLAPPVTSVFGLGPICAAQGVLIAAWTVLHMQRLRDAGRPAGLAVGIAAIYALAFILLLLVIVVAGETDGRDMFQFFAIFYFFAILLSNPQLGMIGYWLIGFLALILLPFVIAFCFSIWAASRPSAPPAP